MVEINEEIDRQHNEIIVGLNSLLYSGMTTMDQVKLVLHISSFYINNHFKDEEKLMLEINYPKEKFEKHKNEHARLSLDYQKFLLKQAHATIGEYFVDAKTFVSSFIKKIEFHIEFFDAPIKEWMDKAKV
jgi:hemerythrin-like metal-binding protein